MIKKFQYKKPFNTEAVVENIPVQKGDLPVGKTDVKDGFTWTYSLLEDDIVYGLGETVRGINKRGWSYTSYAADDPFHFETKHSLYSAHNFFIVSGTEKSFGLFFDYPGKITFDIGYTKQNELVVTADEADIAIYYIEEETDLLIAKAFRKIIGRSYIPPKFAFGFGQSRWGYTKPEDFYEVCNAHEKAKVPIDMIYMDIDYMDHYKDFTVNEEVFPDFKGFVSSMKKKNIHLVPIIDAGVKIEPGYDVYEEGVKNGFFVTREDGSYFEAEVWPGMTHFPDVLNKEARAWFGNKYAFLLDQGIDAFWNDMNEPAIFFSKEGKEHQEKFLQDYLDKKTKNLKLHELGYTFDGIKNSVKDYQSFYHQVDGEKIKHDKVHNLFGYMMTRSAKEAFDRLVPDKRILMFSRSSYVGMHRYGGIWTGDNRSWWSHLLLNLQQLPGLNMCGFLYSGADCGGFSDDVTRDLLLRWYALSAFTPLFRNHSCLGTRRQEFYQFEGEEDFKAVVEARYRLIPYIYSEFMKAALNNDMLFRPVSFDYPHDQMARHIEDQLMFGNEIMICPVYTQNATGRYVYLPQKMMLVRLLSDNRLSTKIYDAGIYFIEIPLSEVVFFVKEGACIPLCAPAMHVSELDYTTISYVGFENAVYDLYDDDGVTPVK